MSKKNVSVKRNYTINKVRRVMRMADNEFEPATYEIFKVTGPNKFKKYFCSRKDAKAYIDKITDKRMTLEVITNLMSEINYK